MPFKKAKREQVWLKVLLTGPSGAGKSYSALRLATGIARKCGSRIAYIGTEGSRDLYYSGEFDYDVIQLDANGNPRDFTDFSPESYIHNIDLAIASGYKVIIVDSLSPEWTYINAAHSALKGNSFTNWGKIKPRHAAFMEKILTAPIHIICCARGKDSWILEDQNGKSVPRKVGLGSQQDKDISYNMTVSLTLNDQSGHTFESDKDNTHLFDNVVGRKISEEDGEALYDWANDSDIPASTKEEKFGKAVATEVPNLDVESLQEEAVKLCVDKGGRSNATLMEILKKYVPNCNPKSLKSANELNDLIAELKALPEVKTA